MVRPSRLVVLLAVASVAAITLAAPGPAAARVSPPGAKFRVVVLDHISDATFAALARRGAVGLLRPSVGPVTTRRRALAELVRGTEIKGRLGVGRHRRPLIVVSKGTGQHAPACSPCIVLQLPAAHGRPVPNDRLYRIAVIGLGYRGVLTSSRTRIPGLVSIVDVARTALAAGHPPTAFSWTPRHDAIGSLASLDRQVVANDRLKFAVLFIVAGLLLLLALLGLRAAVTAIPAALLVNLLLGVTQVSNEVLLIAAISAGTALLAFALAWLCRSDDALLLLFGGVVALYAAVLVTKPQWQAINPFGPTQNSRYWGIGNQVETLLLAPILVGAMIAQRRLGIIGFALFGAFGLVVMTDNRFGADGGGAITLGVALAVLGWRLFRHGLRGFVVLLSSAAIMVLWLVSRGLAQQGPNHLRGAFSGGGRGLLRTLESQVKLSYIPAFHAWTLVLPLFVVCVATFVVAWRRASARPSRDLLLALGIALVTSLLINDSAGYELAGGIAVIAAVARFVPTAVPVRLRVPVFRRGLEAEAVSSDSPPS